MRKCNWSLLILAFLTYSAANAQDEGTLSKMDRVSTPNSFYLFGGPSFKFAGNNGDYCCGFNFEAGYLKRINRLVSIGPAVSFTRFLYDESISNSFGDPDASGNNIYQLDGGYEVYVVELKGGDLKFFSAGVNLKIDFVPYEEGRKISFYGIIKPYLLVSKRSEVTASADLWFANENSPLDNPANWSGGDNFDNLSPKTPGYERWAADTEVTAGANLGIGAELAFPAGFGLFLQSTVVVTLPITYINTSEFPPATNTGYYHKDYPFVKKGFTTLNIAIGAVYHF
ncbi:MAG TPA: hypothetical protein VK666_26695 [Chryseolinea sp.]|nr:hypothetical protein [Chryseolinea sp.]